MAAVPTILRRYAVLALVAIGLIAAIASPRAAQSRSGSAAPRRIVSLVPATTEMLFAMGVGSHVIGVSNYDHFPPEVEKLPRVGGLLDPNTEAILALTPDLVVLYDTQSQLNERLERAGITVYHYVHKGLPDITETMRSLGVAVGAAPAANAAATTIERQLNSIRARTTAGARPKTLLIFGREPGTLRGINASAGYGFLHDVLEIAGGTDVLGDMKRQSAMLSTEMVLTRAPDVIIELHYGDSLPKTRIDVERRVWNALPSVPAVKNNRIYLLSGNEFVVPGPRIVQAAEKFAQVLQSSR